MNYNNDILPLVNSALSALNSSSTEDGELIKNINLNLLDLMSAVEIMDERTDSYLTINKENSSTTGIKTVEFNPNYNLLPPELIWLLDELLSYEMTFQDGHPLISTLFKCQYLRPHNLSQLVNHAQQQQSVGSGDVTEEEEEQEGFKSVVLRAMLLGIIKSTEIVWEELCSGNVYDHEDVQIGTSSLSFGTLLASAFPTVVDPLRIPSQQSEQVQEETPRLVGVHEILYVLEQALIWVEEFVKDFEIKEALIGRLSMRIDLIYALALLTEPNHTTPLQLSEHFNRIKVWIKALSTSSSSSSSSLTKFQPSPILLAIFQPSKKDGPLPSNQPIREIEIISKEKIWSELDEWVLEIEQCLNVWESWRSEGSWIDIREFFIQLGRREVLMKPYSRSLLQSLLSTSSNLFVTSSPSSLASSFFQQISSINPIIWEMLSRIRKNEINFNDPSRKILGWLDRISSTLISILKISGQNRGRGRRLIIKNLSGFGNLIDESKTFIPQITSLLSTHPVASSLPSPIPIPNLSLIPQSLTYLLLTQILEVILSGFELNLYDSEEFIEVWFISSLVSGEILKCLEVLRRVEAGNGEGEYLKGKIEEFKGLELFCRGSILSHLISPRSTPTKYITPFNELNQIDLKMMEKIRFEKRFEWLCKLNLSGLDLSELINWENYHSYLHQLEKESKSTLIDRALADYQQILTHLTSFGSLSMSSRGLNIHPEFPLRWLGSLRRTCFGNINSLTSWKKNLEFENRNEEGTGEKLIKWDNCWFPIWS